MLQSSAYRSTGHACRLSALALATQLAVLAGPPARAADAAAATNPVPPVLDVREDVLRQQREVFELQQEIRDRQAEALEYQRRMLLETGQTSALERLDRVIGGDRSGEQDPGDHVGRHDPDGDAHDGRWHGAADGRHGPRQPEAAIPPAVSGAVIESKVDGAFGGWDGKTIVRLLNGQVWEQTDDYRRYFHAFMPDVVISNSSGAWQMKVGGIDEPVRVQRLK